MSRFPWVIAYFMLTLAFAPAARAIQPWADKWLPVTDGLELWLDASRENAARSAASQPPLSLGQDAVDVWHDASDRRHDVSQSTVAARPRWSALSDGVVMRFDGLDDVLALPSWNAEFSDLTVIVVAAPQSNPGDFRGLMALNRNNVNDYQSGLNLDLGPTSSTRLETFNVEGAGAGGVANLLKQGHDFGTLHTFTLTTKPAAGGVRLYVDGQAAGQRDRQSSKIRADRLTLGARFYNNGGPADTRGFAEADFAEVLIYNRVLSDDERVRVEKYLAEKHAPLAKARIERQPLLGGGHRLVSVPSPAVQMFVPGFAVQRLPLDLPNLNNVKYRRDGKLAALGYNGNIYLLSDIDGDGLEDRAELFWDNRGRLTGAIGMALTPPGYKRGNGMFVTSKGKLSLIVDTNGDDRADEEIVVATGWKVLTHSLDAIAAAVDPKDNSVYFALGTQDYANAYVLDKEGKAHYDIQSERGTILKVSPDFKTRSIVCTGVRWPVGMAINAAGDLFCTDQEGATWLANGNPFDELLHVEPGKHYGFPPRHPKHLPAAIDEPSTFDYGPQHQSTCGVQFNEPVNGGPENGGPVFGPASWRGDALVCGYSRGKLYRTQLVKTPAGYVAQNHLLASLNALTVDACVSPSGALVVSTHSGGPDWGTGPGGHGKLYKIIYRDRAAPQPVHVWPAGPREVRIAFDRPLDPTRLGNLAARTKIEYGRYVAAGDRFELHRPGYAVVEQQLRAPRFDLAVHSVSLTPDGRTLILSTAPHQQSVTYAVTLPDFTRAADAKAEAGDLPSANEIDLQYDLTGVEAAWKTAAGETRQTWLPHLDLTVSKAFTAGSAEHDALWRDAAVATKDQAPRLTLRTGLRLADMLRPAVQPGATLDYTWPDEQAIVQFTSSGQVALDAKDPLALRHTTSTGARLSYTKPGGEPIPVEVRLTAADLKLDFLTLESKALRPLARTRMMLPWAAAAATTTGRDAEPRQVPELAGGSWARGRRLFFSEQALCSRCHALDGQGGAIGPNLSNLRQRDYASVLRDVREPSFAINPDFISYSLLLEDGRVLSGTVRTEADKLLVGDEKGTVTTIARGDVATMKPSTVSVMPKDVHEKLGPDKLRDLLTFLLTPPPSMPLESKLAPPPPRSPDELRAVLAGAPTPPEKTRPIRVLLVAGPKDHGPGEHDYPAWQKSWRELLAVDDTTDVDTAWEWPSAEQLAKADAMVIYQHGSFPASRAKDLDAFLARGGGLTLIHWAVDGTPDVTGFAQRIGLASAGGLIRFRHGPLDLDLSAAKHPIARNFDKVRLVDESYWKLTGDPQRITLLGSAIEEGSATPQLWVREQGRGRVFVSIPGHYSWSFDDPLFRVLLLRGIAWTAREPVDRYNDLVPIGARIRP